MAKGLLQLAGVVSGAGKALQTGLGDIAKYEMSRSLEETRRQYDDLRQQRMLEAQRGMHLETIAATAEQGRLTREHQAGLQQQQLGHDIVKDTMLDARVRELEKNKEKLTRDISKEEILSREKIGRDTNVSHETIARLNRDSNEAIHLADRTLKKYEIETTAESLTRTAASKAISEVGNEITRLNTLMANPMLDPNGPHAKSLVERLKRLEQLHDAYSSYLRPPGAAAPMSEAPKESAPFNLGKFGSKKAAPAPAAVTPSAPQGLLNSPGVRVLPGPSEEIQRQYAPSTIEDEMMRQSIQ